MPDVNSNLWTYSVPRAKGGAEYGNASRRTKPQQPEYYYNDLNNEVFNSSNAKYEGSKNIDYDENEEFYFEDPEQEYYHGEAIEGQDEEFDYANGEYAAEYEYTQDYPEEYGADYVHEEVPAGYEPAYYTYDDNEQNEFAYEEELAVEYEDEVEEDEILEYDDDNVKEYDVTYDDYAYNEAEANNPAYDIFNGPEEAFAEHLQPYTPVQIDARVFIDSVEGKGRCLFARTKIPTGEIIFSEAPVLAAVPDLNPGLWELLNALNDEEALTMPPIWHLAAIYSLTELSDSKQRIILDKWVPDPHEAPSEDVGRVLERTRLHLNPVKYQLALNAWRYNGFGHHVEEHGLILYNKISNMAHSCGASASWHYAGNDTFVLRARRHLQAGEEITISYIRDEDLFAPIHIRRESLKPWLFLCQCNRCSSPDDTCRGFLCPSCASGTVHMKTDYFEEEEYKYYTYASPCKICDYEFTTDDITHYEQLENSYISRLKETSKDNLLDCEHVYVEACRVFHSHHVLFQLEAILCDGYKERGMYEKASHYLLKRIDYIQKSCNRVNYTLSNFWEELGDLYSQALDGDTSIDGFQKNRISRAYENAFNALIVLCGEEHDYTVAAHAKFEAIHKMDWKEIDD